MESEHNMTFDEFKAELQYNGVAIVSECDTNHHDNSNQFIPCWEMIYIDGNGYTLGTHEFPKDSVYQALTASQALDKFRSCN